MKKLFGILLCLGVVLTAIIIGIKSGNRSYLHVTFIGTPPRDGEEASYNLKISAKQNTKGKPSVSLLNVDGILSQRLQAPGEYVSLWSEIKAMTIADTVISPSALTTFLQKPAVTTFAASGVNHYLGEDFPKQFFRIQLGILQKIFITVPPTLTQNIEKKEADDLGEYTVSYSGRSEGRNYLVDKTWISFARPGMTVDPNRNTIRYIVTQEGRLLAIQGQLILDYQSPQGPTQFVIDISAQLQGSKSAPKNIVPRESLRLADAKSAEEVTNRLQTENGMSYDEAMASLSSLTDKSDTQELYHIFSAIKADLRAHPDHAAEVIKRIQDSASRDPSTRRQLTVLFGALAQSNNSDIADSLVQLANDCPDNFCKVQAIVALNDHTQPSTGSASKMIDIADKSSDKEVSATALLAAGSIGRKLDAAVPELPKEMLREFNDPSKIAIKQSVIAAMGNHGSSEYLPALKETLASKDSSLRSTAAYSLRNISDPSVNPVIVDLIQKEKSPSVLREALKAMAGRSMTASEYNAIAAKAETFDKDLQQDAVRFMIDAYRRGVKEIGPALNALREKSAFPGIKSYIDSEVKAVDAISQ